MRVAEGDAIAVEEPEEEPKDDLAVAVALGLVGAPHGLEALPGDVLGHQHAPRARGRCAPAGCG